MFSLVPLPPELLLFHARGRLVLLLLCSLSTLAQPSAAAAADSELTAAPCLSAVLGLSQQSGYQGRVQPKGASGFKGTGMSDERQLRDGFATHTNVATCGVSNTQAGTGPRSTVALTWPAVRSLTEIVRPKIDTSCAPASTSTSPPASARTPAFLSLRSN
jgi:hypothetical protein